MPIVDGDRVRETSTTTGTGTYSLAGAVAGFRTFVAGTGTGNICRYVAEDGTNWETGLGTVTDAATDTLARTVILSSSNAGAAVNWGAGTRNIFSAPLASADSGVFLVGSSRLGSAGAAITLVAPVGLTKLWGHAFVKAPGALVPRLFLGGAAVDGGLNYASTVALANVNAVSAVSFNGWNLIVAALAAGNRTTIDFWIQKSAAGEMARANWKTCGISSAITVAPTLTEGCGLWGNTVDLMQRIELRGKTAITGNTDANMDTGSELCVFGSYE